MSLGGTDFHLIRALHNCPIWRRLAIGHSSLPLREVHQSRLLISHCWNKISNIPNEGSKGVFSLEVSEVLVHNQLAPRQGVMAKGQFMVSASDNRSKKSKRTKRGRHSSFPLLYCMLAPCPWESIALTTPIPVVDNEPVTSTRFNCLHDCMRLWWVNKPQWFTQPPKDSHTDLCKRYLVHLQVLLKS